MKRYIAENDINLYIINGIKIAEEVGLRGRASTILQSAFFTISRAFQMLQSPAEIRRLPYQQMLKQELCHPSDDLQDQEFL